MSASSSSAPAYGGPQPRRSVAELLLLERRLQQELTLNSIQLERSVELFRQRVARLAEERAVVEEAVAEVREDLRRHSLMAELLGVPAELAEYVRAVAPPFVSADLYVGEAEHEGLGNAAAEDGGLVRLGVSSVEAALAVEEPTAVDNLALQQCLAAERIIVAPATAGSAAAHEPSHQGRLQQLHAATGACSAFVPTKKGNKGGNAKDIVRRPATAHFAICESTSEVDMGRRVVSRGHHSAGDLLFAERPFLTLTLASAANVAGGGGHEHSGGGGSVGIGGGAALAVADAAAAGLTHTYRALLDRIVGRRDVFTAQKWDPRLATAYVGYLCECSQRSPAGRARLRSAVAALCCPLQSIEASRLSSLCEYAHFVHAALPHAMASEHEGGTSEDDIVAFFVAFQTNALAHGQRQAAPDAFVAAALSSEEKHSLFAFTSLLEHSCDPNAVAVVRSLSDPSPHPNGGNTSNFIANDDPSSGLGDGLEGEGYLVEVRAFRPIGVGEAISIAYCGTLPPTAQRRRALRSRYYFDCMCRRCTREADVSRRFITADGAVACPVGEGARWAVGGSVLSAEASSGPTILPLLKMEARLLEASAARPADGEGEDEEAADGPQQQRKQWAEVFSQWRATDEEGYARLAPEHFAVVAAACMHLSTLGAAAATAASNGDGLSAEEAAAFAAEWASALAYVARLVGRIVCPAAEGWVLEGSAAAKATHEAMVRYDYAAVDNRLAHACAVPVLEAAAACRGALDTAMKCGPSVSSAALWYLAHKLIAVACRQPASDRALRAKLMAAPLL